MVCFCGEGGGKPLSDFCVQFMELPVAPQENPWPNFASHFHLRRNSCVCVWYGEGDHY